MRLINSMTLLLAAGALTLFAACGDDPVATTDTTQNDTSVTDTGGDTESDTNVETDTTVTGDFATIVFTIDDSANKTYDSTDKLAWKGSFNYDATTGVVTLDTTWGGPYPYLFDDGTHGDATAGDNIWTCEMMFATPDAAVEFEYGAVRNYSGEGNGGDWIWNGDGNGKFTVPANETGTVTATGMVVEPFGTTDLKLTLDLSNSAANLDPLFAGTDYATVTVKGGKWGWNEVAMLDDGTKGDDTADDDIYTFVLSENLGKHDGLLKEGDQATFVFVLDSVEYKVDGAPSSTGVGAYLDSGSGFEPAAILAYPDGDKNTYVEVGAEPFTQPANTVAVNFTVDDSANQTYDDTDKLAWKGSFNYNAETRVLAYSGSWDGPYPYLYDDGPWSAGGHEPAGSTAGDHVWGVTVFIDNTAAQAFEYGLVRNYSGTGNGGDWIWNGSSNGTFNVTAGATTAIDADGMTIGAFGTTDFKVTLDLSSNGANLNSGFSGNDWTSPPPIVKGTVTGWGRVALVDDGTKGDDTASDGLYTYVLSENIGKNDGLLKSGDAPEFIFVLGGTVASSDDGQEYKASGNGATEGVAAYTKPDAGTWTSQTINIAGNGNTSITVP